MKKIVLLIGAILVANLGQAQEDTRIGGFLAYGTEVESLGIGANAEFPIATNLVISPSLIYYFPREEEGIDINWFEANGNVNYYFLDSDGIGFYGLAGLNYTSVKVSGDSGFGGDISVSDGRLGLNLGAGANFIIGGSVIPFAELKYVIIDEGQLVLMGGVKFNI